MRTDRTFALLERENPVREDDLPGPESDEARALERRIVLRQVRPRRRRLVVRLAAVGLAVAAVGFGALSLLPGDGPSAVERATAALNPSGDAILHTVVVGIRSDDAGSPITETWVRTSPPYDQRYVMRSGRAGREGASRDGSPEHYDPMTNTIYTVPREAQTPSVSRTPRVKRYVEGDVSVLDDIRALLASGDARDVDRVTIGGRDGIRIAFAGTKTTFVVDGETYVPIESSSVGDDGSVATIRFRTYELLPPTKENLALLSLRAQHPGARVAQTPVEGVGAAGEKGE